LYPTMAYQNWLLSTEEVNSRASLFSFVWTPWNPVLHSPSRWEPQDSSMQEIPPAAISKQSCQDWHHWSSEPWTVDA
jgi:hypothetical protein